MQTCPLHDAQANFRKSLRRGFLSLLAAKGTSEEHFSPCKARGGLPASSQAEDAWQTSDVEVQASLIQAEQDKADLLAKQLQECREEAAWLRRRVCQLQQNKPARDSAAAQAAVLPPSHTVARQALQHCRHFHANVGSYMRSGSITAMMTAKSGILALFCVQKPISLLYRRYAPSFLWCTARIITC
ncbi:TPA: hypothetical protein ACH3X3_005104 [Trebouxia sp. C0006]